MVFVEKFEDSAVQQVVIRCFGREFVGHDQVLVVRLADSWLYERVVDSFTCQDYDYDRTCLPDLVPRLREFKGGMMHVVTYSTSLVYAS